MSVSIPRDPLSRCTQTGEFYKLARTVPQEASPVCVIDLYLQGNSKVSAGGYLVLRPRDSQAMVVLCKQGEE